MKCTGCNKTKAKNKFGIKKGRPNPRCKECMNAYQKAYWEKNPLKYAAHKGRAYGISGEEYLALKSGACEICETKPATVVDHCHSTGKVRGGLCRDCNLAIGHFSDSVQSLKRAIQYLSKDREPDG